MKAQVGLTLSPEHLAELNYYRDSGPQITYQGARGVHVEQGIILLFNARNGRAASESIPLQRHGETLSADYRLLNGGKAYFDVSRWYCNPVRRRCPCRPRPKPVPMAIFRPRSGGIHARGAAAHVAG